MAKRRIIGFLVCATLGVFGSMQAEEHVRIGPLQMSDTSLVLMTSGKVDWANSWHYVVGGGIENNVRLTLANQGLHTIHSPQININGDRFPYTFRDWFSRIPLENLTTTDDTLKAVWYYVSRNYTHWLVSSDNTNWTVPPLRSYAVFGAGLCDHVSQIVNSLLGYLGFSDSEVRVISNSHTISVIRLRDGREVVLDADVEALYPQRGSERLASFDDLVADQDLVGRQRHYGYQGSETVSDALVAAMYNDVIPTWGRPHWRIDSLAMTLRPHESVVFDFGRLPEEFHSYFNVLYPIENDRGAPPADRLGTQSYIPRFDSTFLADHAEANNVTIEGGPEGEELVAIDPLRPASMTLEFATPFVYTGGSIAIEYQKQHPDDTLLLWFRKLNGGERVPLTLHPAFGTGIFRDSLDLYSAIRPVGTPVCTAFELIVEWSSGEGRSCRVRSLECAPLFQFNPAAVPKLRAGRNEIALYSATSSSLAGLAVEFAWNDHPTLSRPLPVVSGFLPRANDVVTTDSLRLTWLASLEGGGEAAAAYCVQVSSRPDFPFPVSSLFDRITASVPGTASQSITVPVSGHLTSGEVYYWRVCARSGSGAWSEWSQPIQFRIGLPGIPADPSLSWEDGLLSLTWRPPAGSDGSERYIVLGSTISGFSPTEGVPIDTIDGNRFCVSLDSQVELFAFYRIVTLSRAGIRSGASALVRNDRRRVYVPPLLRARRNGDAEVPYRAIHPTYRYGQTTTGIQSDIDSTTVFSGTTSLPVDESTARVHISLHGSPDSVVELSWRTKDQRGNGSSLCHVYANRPPAFVHQEWPRATEDQEYVVRVLVSDPDAALFGDQARLHFLRLPAWLAVDSVNGTLSGRPRGVDILDSLVVVVASDDSLASDTLRMVIGIDHVNHPPSITGFRSDAEPHGALKSHFQATEGRPFRVLIVASDPDSALFADRFECTLVDAPAWLSIDRSTGVLTGVPGAEDVGTWTITTRATDDSGAAVSASFTVAVVHLNHVPEFQALSLPRAIEDVPFRAGVHAIDKDTLLFNDRVRYSLASRPSWMSIDQNTGIMTGTPGIRDLADSVFTVLAVDDSSAADTLDVIIGISHMNHAPVASPIDPIAAEEDTMYACVFRATDRDTVVGDRVTYRMILGPGWLTVDSTTGRASGIPRGGDVGTGLLTLVLSDDSGSSAIVELPYVVRHTNHNPVFVVLPEKTAGAVEDTPFTMTCAATDTDTHSYGDSLTYSLVVHPHWLSIDSSTGIVTGTPAEGDHDTTFTIGVTDGAASTTLTVALPVEQVNDPPVFTGRLSLTLTEDSSGMIDLLPLVQDPDNQHEALQWGLDPSIEGADFHFCSAPPDGSPLHHADDDSLVIFLDTTTARVYVQARKNFNGTGLPVVVSVHDPDGLQAVDTLRLNIIPVNDPPVLAHVADITMAEDDSVLLSQELLHALVSDPDDDDSLLVWRVSGSGTLDPSWTVSGVRIHAATNWNGTDSITIAVMDGAGLVDSTRFAVHVEPVNDAPVVAALPDLMVRGDSVIAFSLAPYIADVDDSIATVRALVSPLEPSASDPQDLQAHGTGKSFTAGSLHFTVDSLLNVTIHAIGQSRRTAIPVLVRAFDPQGGIGYDTLFLTVTPSPLAPVILAVADTAIVSGQQFSMRVRVQLTDGESGALTYRVEGAAWLCIDSSGVLSGTPPAASEDNILVIVMNAQGAADSLRFRIVVRADESSDVPADYVLFQNYPNPFNPATTIRFGLPEASRVTAEVFNILGQRVATILSSELHEGYHTMEWSPVGLASGAYIIVLEAHGLVSQGRDSRMIKKVSLIR